MEQVPELPRTGTAGWIRLPSGKITFTTTTKRAAQTRLLYLLRKGSADQGASHHNQQGRCSCCRHPVVFKAYDERGICRQKNILPYLIQRCKDGFVVREFQADRTYGKESLPNSKLYCQEIRRTIYDRERKPRTYYWGLYKQRNMRWDFRKPCSYSGLVHMMDGSMEKRCQLWNRRNFDAQGWSTGFGSRKVLTRKNIWQCLERIPQMEQISKVNLRSLPRNVSVPAEQSVN